MPATPVVPIPLRKRSDMTVPIPLTTLPAAATSRDITGHPSAPGALGMVSRPAGPALATHAGHDSQPSPPGSPTDRSGLWLRNAAAGLVVLAAAAAVVSFTAQYRLAEAARRLPAAAALEAAIPDAAALVFGCLGVALALHGRRALRARALNLAAAGTSVFMNAVAAAPGWRNLVIWAMPPAAYALASDTLIGVVRAWALARHRHLDAALAGEEATPLAVLGGLVLWLLRLVLAPASTVSGFRAWVTEQCPVAPGRRAASPARPPGAGQGDGAAEGDQDRPLPGSGHRTARAAGFDPAARHRADRRSRGPAGRPAPRRRPGRAAQGGAGRAGRRAPVMIRYAIALAVVLVLAAFAAWAFLPARYLPGNRARHLRIRRHLRLHPGKGFAHAVSLHLRWGRVAALRRSARIRPSLPLWCRVVGPGQQSVFLGRAQYRHGLRVPLEEHLLVLAPPRTYKTAFLADVILRYPGPVLATSTKPDLYALTAAVRAGVGPVHVFNPQRTGGVGSTFCWDPVAGCQDPATAIRRADAFAFAVSHKGVEDATFWSAKASDYLRGYFHAAALARYDLRAVAAWVAGASPDVPERILAAAGARQWAHTLAELRSEAHKTAATVRMVMSRALAFLADPALAESVLPGPGGGFSIPAFLSGRGTVYLIAEAVSEDAPVAPLFAAMASEIHWTAAQAGQASPSGRLDPPLLMGLDEVTQICPVPLPFWLADSGGKGIQVCAVVHGEAQLAARWGDHGRQVVLDTCSVKVFLPGITDVTTLEAAAKLCGQASWKVRGQDHVTRHEVATPDMIRQLPAGFALVIRGGCAPVIARLPRAWRNLASRRARRPPRDAAGFPAAGGQPQPDVPDYVPAEWLPGDGTSFPWS